ncbi:phosphate butyryltransferase [Deferribacter desulfuricans SSM1]|uniref:Phosphate butyryltransferase n=1 Tax=Deferribacter desulfuricans (strain DSM 14783 / JCM 11476 / NBRC 101012 / SSM1) TaxID=639282 RepID=D3PDN5_DEFDS|nr:phosphate acyltransferase [Deferribacter desulfuricans]BAI80708.1 phosphate butyryltransferase [Deferribacter desulfuricans SSM1]
MQRFTNKFINTGDNIKKLLAKKGLDKEEILDLLKIDEEEFNLILNGEVQPSVSQLLKISSFLNVTVSQLLYGTDDYEKKVVKTTPQERVVIKRKEYLVYENLAPKFSNKEVEPFLVDIYKTKAIDIDESVHNGEEFIYLIEGKVKLTIDEKEYILDVGDTIYFDSSLKHKIESLTDKSRIFATIYYGDTMLYKTKGKKMKDLISAAKAIGKQNIVLINPDDSSIEALNKAIIEGLINRAFLVGDNTNLLDKYSNLLSFSNHYDFVHIDNEVSDYYQTCAKKAVELIKEKKADYLMKGNINTAIMLKEILNKEHGIPTGRRISLVSIFELFDREKFILLTDPAINPELFPGGDLELAKDIVNNAIDVAFALGMNEVRVALLDANEIPTEKIPSTILEQKLSKLRWHDNVYVYGPLSYDLALYEEAAKKKGLKDNPVAGNADILVVPHIEAGNFLYKSWAMTMGADVANIVVGAKSPIVITSRSDSDMVKFLTICANAIYAHHLKNTVM